MTSGNKRKASSSLKSTIAKASRTSQSQSPSKKRDASNNETKDPTPEDRKLGRKKIRRNEKQRKIRLEADGKRCVVTQLRHPQVAHIVPFAWNSCQDNLNTTAALIGPGLTFFHLQAPYELAAGIGSSDKAWNMICLSPTLHAFWSKAYFGLKRLGWAPLPNDRETARIRLQFVWLPRAEGNQILGPVNLDVERPGSGTSLFKHLRDHVPDWDLHTVNARTKVSVQSGQTFYIDVPVADVGKTCQVLDMQWAFGRLAAMSGAAEAYENGFLPPPDAEMMTLFWVKQQQENYQQGAQFEHVEQP